MTAEEIQKHVDKIIENTFNKLQTSYSSNKKGNNHKPKINNRLIFPHYRLKKNKTPEIRISEQELRFAFAEAFIQYCAKPTTTEHSEKVKKWHYSIETPTAKKYIFTKKNGDEKDIPRQDDNGQSARFDFVIHDKKLNRICLIEFKALNPEPKEYHKDLEKLINDMPEKTDVARYFIQVLRSCNQNTISSIGTKLNGKKGKYKEYILNATPKIEYRCYVLKEGKNKDITQYILKELKNTKTT